MLQTINCSYHDIDSKFETVNNLKHTVLIVDTIEFNPVTLVLIDSSELLMCRTSIKDIYTKRTEQKLR